MKKLVFYILILCFILPLLISAQISDYISRVEFLSNKEGEPLSVKAELVQTNLVSRIEFVYKTFGENEFLSQEMNILGTSATVIVPGETIIPPFIEYFLLIYLKDGTTSSYPIGAPESAAPYRIDIIPVSDKDKEVIILSPEKNELVNLSDLLISISLLKATDNVDRTATKIYINENDVSSMALFADDLILFYPENFSGIVGGGTFLLRVELYDKNGELYHTVSSSFVVFIDSESSIFASTFNYTLDFEAESRNESFDDENNWYNNIALRFNGDYKDWNFKANTYVTSEEKSYLQPQNRYFAEVSNPWMNLKLGDNFPRYPELILNGKRVRGATGHLTVGFFNLAATYGQLNRSVEGSITEYLSEDPLESNVVAIDSNKYGSPFGRVDFGTYNRNLFTIRAAAEGNNYGFGVSYLHSKDDENSIELGSKPQENLVVGTDFRIAFDSRRIELTAEGAASMYNSNIAGGSLTDAQIDSLENYGTGDFLDVGTLRSLNDYLSPFITVNQYLKPINPEELSSFAGGASLRLNYFGNYFKASYIYRGGDFQSFGQSYLRTDVKGINILDRIKLFNNKVFISLGYENLSDNLNDTKTTTSGTTTYQTINASISIYPRTNLPNITLGYTRYDNSNGKVDSLYGIDNGTNNLSASVYYNFIAGAEHKTNFNVTSSIKDDKSVYNTDANIVSAVFGFNSKWTQSFSTILRLIYSNSEINSPAYSDTTSSSITKYNYTTANAGVNFLLFDARLDFTLTGGMSFGDYKRLAIDFYGNYKVLPNFLVGFQARYYKIEDLSNNSIFGLTARYIL